MNIRRFREQPVHRRLLEKAVKALKGDDRVKGLYLSGTPSTDDYSDIDLFILSSVEDREGLERDRVKTAGRVGEIVAEAMSTVPHTYVVVYEPGVKMDYCYHVLPEKPRPDRVFVDVLYDPSGHIEEVIEMSKTASIGVSDEYLRNLVKHFYVALHYATTKLGRGELWESRDTVEYYRGLLISFEHILDSRERVGYRRLEQKLSKEKLLMLEKTIPKDVTRVESVRALDAVLEYFDEHLKPRLTALGAYPETQAMKMVEYYEREKRKILRLRETLLLPNDG